MAFKMVVLMPCASFFESGRVADGVLALLMQLSLVFWPKAIAWARSTADSSAIDRMLQEFSNTHRVPVDQYAAPAKRFRQAA